MDGWKDVVDTQRSFRLDFDPGTVLQAAEGPAGGSLLAVVPGADNVDPWTGDRLGPPVPRSLLGPSAPVATPAPSGGTRVPESGGEGCAGGSGPMPWLALALILLGRCGHLALSRRGYRGQ